MVCQMSRVAALFTSAVLACAVTAGAAAAQDYTADQLRDLFEQQKEAVDLGETRGLKLITLEGGATESDDSETGAQVAAAPQEGEEYIDFEDGLKINYSINFGFDSAALADSEKPKLTAMCEALQTSPVELVRIVGHTDASGTDAYNERLSILRAEEVARHLTQECGIAPERLETMGVGERFPLNAEDPRAEENRRVEFQALS
jgi:outer membrane protein OmpA-like peptidoglycan-associated protein